MPIYTPHKSQPPFKEIEKYFEVEVKPETIYHKARRDQGVSNEPPDATHRNITGNGPIQTIQKESNELETGLLTVNNLSPIGDIQNLECSQL